MTLLNILTIGVFWKSIIKLLEWIFSTARKIVCHFSRTFLLTKKKKIFCSRLLTLQSLYFISTLQLLISSQSQNCFAFTFEQLVQIVRSVAVRCQSGRYEQGFIFRVCLQKLNFFLRQDPVESTDRPTRVERTTTFSPLASANRKGLGTVERCRRWWLLSLYLMKAACIVWEQNVE